MFSEENRLPHFSKGLFWDIDPSALDAERHARLIIERVLSDWKKLYYFYGAAAIQKAVVNVRYLDQLTLNFCSTFLTFPNPLLDVTHSRSLSKNSGNIERNHAKS
jgi:hypothetical protein